MLNKLTTLLWKIFFVILMLATLLVLPLLLLAKPFLRKKAYRRLVNVVAALWGRITVSSTGTKISFEGRELIPNGENLCFIGNHQSLFDIPSFLGWIGRPAGFIAKKELFRIPVLSQWMSQLPCLFIDRGDARQAMRSFQRSAKIIREGFPLVIFPEGGRSGGPEMRPFHIGSLKLATMAGATIVPFAIDGTWRIMGTDSQIHAARVKIRILPPIKPDNHLYRDKNALSDHIRDLMQANLSLH